MGMRFRKSKKIAPGVRLNLSAKSASISIGPKGFKKTFSTSGRVTTTVGIPGTGLSYSTSTKMGQTAAGSTSQEAPAAAVVASNKNKWVTLALCVFLLLWGSPLLCWQGRHLSPLYFHRRWSGLRLDH